MMAGALVLSACADSLPPRQDLRLCPQTYEFGNYGCARITGRIFAPDGSPAAGPFVHVRLEPLDSVRGRWLIGTFASPESDGRFTLQPTRMDPARDSAPADTHTVRVIGLWLDNPPNWPLGVLLPVRAADTVVRRIRIVPVGQPMIVDTIEFRLRGH